MGWSAPTNDGFCEELAKVAEPNLRGEDVEQALGLGFNLCLRQARDGPRRIRDRHLRPQDRRLACFRPALRWMS